MSLFPASQNIETKHNDCLIAQAQVNRNFNEVTDIGAMGFTVFIHTVYLLKLPTLVKHNSPEHFSLPKHSTTIILGFHCLDHDTKLKTKKKKKKKMVDIL